MKPIFPMIEEFVENENELNHMLFMENRTVSIVIKRGAYSKVTVMILHTCN